MSAIPPTPIRSTAASRAELLANSPHYSTTRRHSLYGTEDRIVIDPGSRIWKTGFSGEGRPRDVFTVKPWGLGRYDGKNALERMEEERVLELELQDLLRGVFFDSLLADPKSRKVIVIEPPLLPVAVKDIIARILFRNLQVPSLSFMPSHLLSLIAVGRVTGLVLDCGHSESTILPIYSSRPMFPHTRTTPLAGARLTAHLRALLLLFGSYRGPPTIIRASTMAPQLTRIPEEILTETVLEQIKTKCLFVGATFDKSSLLSQRDDNAMDIDIPSTRTPSESGSSSRISSSAGDRPPSPAPSGSVASSSVLSSAATRPESELRSLAELYQRESTATDVQIPVIPPPAHAAAAGSGLNARGTIIIPGWVRERAAEVLFDGGDVDEKSIVELVLDALVKVPMDLRKTLASSILVVGGTAMLPGFIPRLHAEIVRTLGILPQPRQPIPQLLSAEGRSTPTPGDSQEPVTPTATRFPQQRQQQPSPKRPRPPYDPYAPIRTLGRHIAILNNPSHTGLSESSSTARSQSGKAPGFAPALLPWVGGSLAGALKIGSEDIPREKWDDAWHRDHEEHKQELETLTLSALPSTPPPPGSSPRKARAEPISTHIAVGAGVVFTDGGGLRPPASASLPDWTRGPLSVGAPNVLWIPPHPQQTPETVAMQIDVAS